jgi:hypothetical protein
MVRIRNQAKPTASDDLQLAAAQALAAHRQGSRPSAVVCGDFLSETLRFHGGFAKIKFRNRTQGQVRSNVRRSRQLQLSRLQLSCKRANSRCG